MVEVCEFCWSGTTTALSLISPPKIFSFLFFWLVEIFGQTVSESICAHISVRCSWKSEGQNQISQCVSGNTHRSDEVICSYQIQNQASNLRAGSLIMNFRRRYLCDEKTHLIRLWPDSAFNGHYQPAPLHISSFR